MNRTSLVATIFALTFASTWAVAQQASPASATTAAQEKPKAPVLDRAQVDALLAKPDQVVVIDVRRPDEQTAKGSFPVYLSIQNKDLEKNLAFIPKDRTIITVSNHAGRATGAAALLISKGFKVAGATGVETYEAEGGTLQKLTPPPPRPAAAPEAAAK